MPLSNTYPAIQYQASQLVMFSGIVLRYGQSLKCSSSIMVVRHSGKMSLIPRPIVMLCDHMKLSNSWKSFQVSGDWPHSGKLLALFVLALFSQKELLIKPRVKWVLGAAPCFARSSAFSLPGTLTWLGIHCRHMTHPSFINSYQFSSVLISADSQRWWHYLILIWLLRSW